MASWSGQFEGALGEQVPLVAALDALHGTRRELRGHGVDVGLGAVRAARVAHDHVELDALVGDGPDTGVLPRVVHEQVVPDVADAELVELLGDLGGVGVRRVQEGQVDADAVGVDQGVGLDGGQGWAGQQRSPWTRNGPPLTGRAMAAPSMPRHRSRNAADLRIPRL